MDLTDETLKKLKFKKNIDKTEGFYYWTKKMKKFEGDFDLISNASDERINGCYQITFWGGPKVKYKTTKELKTIFKILKQ